jgi:sortase A
VALGCLGTYGYAYVDRILYQARESREFERSLRRASTAALSAPGFTRQALQEDRASRKRSSSLKLPSPAARIGRLTIPRLRLTAMVREGVDSNTLRVAVGHLPETPLPGQAGNVAVAGHRDTFFRGLKNVRARDEIEFSTPAGDFKYEVESLSIVEPDNLKVIGPSSENVLTLVTCYPFSYVGSAPQRFVVRAKQVSPQYAPPSDVE